MVKEYTYNAEHINFLKKQNSVRLVFMLIFSLILFLQAMLWLIVWYKDMNMSITDMAFVGVTLTACLFLVISQAVGYKKDSNTIKSINEDGSCVVRKFNINFGQKHSFAWGLMIVYRVLSVVLVVLLAIMLVNFFKDYLNWGKIALKMPMVMMMVAGFLSTSAALRFEERLNNNQLD